LAVIEQNAGGFHPEGGGWLDQDGATLHENPALIKTIRFRLVTHFMRAAAEIFCPPTLFTKIGYDLTKTPPHGLLPHPPNP
jgi:hypothetical protein